MSDALSSTPQTPAARPNHTQLVRAIFYLGLVAAVAVTSYAAFRLSEDRAYVARSQQQLVASHHLRQPTENRLAPEYTDKNGDLVADPPSDPKQFLDPDTLVLAHYVDAEAETQAVNWEAFEAQLAQATGKQVVRREYLNTSDDVAAVKAGQIHLVALHAADAPYLVNHAGLVPIGVLGSDEGAHGNRLDIAVPAKSKLQTVDDVAGHVLTCTSPDSITGYRAAIVVLLEKSGLRPHQDYAVTWSHGQKRSILGLLSGKTEVAALSDDKLQSLLKKGTIGEADYRVIYRSQVIPRLTIGYVYNLDPKLAGQLVTASLNFQNEGGQGEDDSSPPMRFLPVDYKKDFEFVRRIDDSFDPRFGKQARPKAPLDEDARQSKE